MKVYFMHNIQYKESDLLSIEFGDNEIGVKCCLRTRQKSVWSVTSDVFWYESKGKHKITLYLFVKNHISHEVDS